MKKELHFKVLSWIFVLFFVICLPNSFKMSSQIQTTCIVVGFGIDKHEQGFQVSAQVVIPQAGGEYSQTQEIISNTGKNLPEAVSNLEIKTGKKLGLAHCHVLVISKDLCTENIMPYIDYLLRSDIMDNNSVLLYTNKTAKDLLKASSQINTSDLNNLQNITSFNTKQEASSRLSLIDFVNDYLSATKVSIFSSIDPPENQQQSQNSSNSGNQSPNSTSSTSTDAATLENEGKSVVFHNGTKILDLSRQDMHCINWFNIKTQNGLIEIHNVNDKTFELKDATIYYDIHKKTINLKPSIIDNCPILNVEINLNLSVTEIINQDKIVASGLNLITEDMNNKINTVIENEINSALLICKQNKVDILKAYNIFNKSINKEWQTYLATLPNESDYIENLKIFVKTTCKLRN